MEEWDRCTDILYDIERGLDPEKIEVISRSTNAENVYLDLLKSANKEIMLNISYHKCVYKTA